MYISFRNKTKQLNNVLVVDHFVMKVICINVLFMAVMLVVVVSSIKRYVWILSS